MFEPGPNDALSQNFMKLGLLVAEKNVDRQTNPQDSCFISIDVSRNQKQILSLNFAVYHKTFLKPRDLKNVSIFERC